jgi:hypothetical protein
LRSKIGKIGIAFAFALVICGVAAGPALAADQHGHGNQGGGQHHGDSDRDGQRDGGHSGRGYQGYDNYYAPGPNYYSAPEPDYYYAPQPAYYPRQPSQGVNLFFGF